MSFTPIEPDNPLKLDLTRAFCADNHIQPFVQGDTVAIRFQHRDYDEAAVSLSGATVVMTITSQDGSTTFTRTSAVVISGSTQEIKIDTDQSAETGYTGKGWFQVNVLPSEATDLDDLAGQLCNYRIQITAGDGSVVTAFMGRIDIIANDD